MNTQEYLNEEQYQKVNKKIKMIGLIIMIIGFCLIIGAIITLISASQMRESSMLSLNWFEDSTAKMHRKALGLFMLFPGIFITMVGCVVRFIIGNLRQINAYSVQQTMPIAKEGIEKMAPTVGRAAGEFAKGIKEGLNSDDK